MRTLGLILVGVTLVVVMSGAGAQAVEKADVTITILGAGPVQSDAGVSGVTSIAVTCGVTVPAGTKVVQLFRAAQREGCISSFEIGGSNSPLDARIRCIESLCKTEPSGPGQWMAGGLRGSTPITGCCPGARDGDRMLFIYGPQPCGQGGYQISCP